MHNLPLANKNRYKRQIFSAFILQKALKTLFIKINIGYNFDCRFIGFNLIVRHTAEQLFNSIEIGVALCLKVCCILSFGPFGCRSFLDYFIGIFYGFVHIAAVDKQHMKRIGIDFYLRVAVEAVKIVDVSTHKRGYGRNKFFSCHSTHC